MTNIKYVPGLFLALMLAFAACKPSDSKQENSAIDVSRTFIRSSLDGNFIQAQSMLSNDARNDEYFKAYKDYYEKMSNEEKQNFRNASFEINSINDLNDSTALINYSNSYMKQPIELKAIKENGQWKIDFKHTYLKQQP